MPTLKSYQTDLEVHKLYRLIYGLVGYRMNDALLISTLDTFTEEDYQDSLAILNRLEFVYVVDRFSAHLEDVIRFRLENRPTEAYKAKKRHLSAKPTLEQVREQVGLATLSLAHGSLAEITKKILGLTGTVILRDSELAYARYFIEMRNLLVHRGEVIDQKFIDRSLSMRFTTGQTVVVPRASDVNLKLKRIASRADDRLNFGRQSPVASRRYTDGKSPA